MPLYDLGDGIPRHSRSFSHALGTRSREYLERHGVDITPVSQGAKHRYIYLLDRSLHDHIRVPVLAYPKAKGEFNHTTDKEERT